MRGTCDGGAASQLAGSGAPAALPLQTVPSPVRTRRLRLPCGAAQPMSEPPRVLHLQKEASKRRALRYSPILIPRLEETAADRPGGGGAHYSFGSSGAP